MEERKYAILEVHYAKITRPFARQVPLRVDVHVVRQVRPGILNHQLEVERESKQNRAL